MNYGYGLHYLYLEYLLLLSSDVRRGCFRKGRLSIYKKSQSIVQSETQKAYMQI